MDIYLLDTTTLTHLRNDHPRVVAECAIHDNPASADVVGVATVNVEEAVSGWLSRLNRARTPQDEAHVSELLNDSIKMLARFTLYAVTDASVIRYETLRKMKLNGMALFHFFSVAARTPE